MLTKKTTSKNDLKRKALRKILSAGISFALVFAMFTPINAFGATKTISEKIADKEAALSEAKADLETALKKYEKAKQKAASKIKVTDEDLALTGRNFIDKLVKEAYAVDKNDNVSADKLVPLKRLTVKGHITKAKNNSTCLGIINKVNKNAPKDKTFEASINHSLSIKNLHKAIDYIEECNMYREKNGRKPLKVSPYLMAGTAISAALSSRSTHIYVTQKLFVTYDSTRAYEGYYYFYYYPNSGNIDPFDFWYVSEKRRADQGETTGISHLRMILSKNNKQTGFNYNEKNFDGKSTFAQSFTKDSGGKAYTTKKFRKMLDEYVEEEKARIIEEKASELPIYKNKPDYVVEAEEAYDKALAALKKTVKSYTPDVKTTNFNYNTITVKYDIKAGYDGVIIYRSDTGKTGTFDKISKKTKGTYKRDRKLTCGKKYYYKIALYKNVEGKLVKSHLSAVSVRKARPTKVKGLGAVSEKGIMSIIWKKAVGAQNYVISVKKDGGQYAELKTGVYVNGLVLKKRAETELGATATVTEPGSYTIKVRCYRVVNGKRVYGPYSETFTIDIL
ncbi:MAG: hypothetical protein IIU36_03690 [Firmicutes bacterium]|nr:hypothetical protein [Bacillota bacterium]